MALNPVVFTEKVVRSFLRYQLTAYPFADERLNSQMRRLLSLDQTRQSPLLKGPYVSLSRPFRQGAAVEGLIRDGLFHPHMRQRIPEEIKHVYGHQEDAIRAIHARMATLALSSLRKYVNYSPSSLKLLKLPKLPQAFPGRVSFRKASSSASGGRFGFIRKSCGISRSCRTTWL